MTVEKPAESEERPEKNQLRAGDNVKEHAIDKQAQNIEYKEASQAGQDFTSMASLKVPTVQERTDGYKTGADADFGKVSPAAKVDSFGINMDDGSTVTARPRPGKVDQAPLPGSAEDTGRVTDYQWKESGKGTFALGMDYEEGAVDTRTPSEKMGDFLKAASARATDPEGWQKYIDGQVEKFIGIGEGLDMAKEHTKEAVVAGWTALTDGTVANFLSKPNAINDPLFNTVGGALDAMAQDPNAVNHALERLGTSIMQASEHYSSLPDREKGQVIGEAAFFLINPEGSTEAGEAALKIADRVATGVDKVVMDGIRASVKSAEEMAAATPELADQARRMLYDYTGRLGLSPKEMEAAGIPRGYFDGIEPPPGAGKGDNVYAMSKADDAAIELEGRTKLEGKAGAGAGGEWPIINERPSPDVVKQSRPDACVAAIGEMLSDGALKQANLIEKVGTVPERLAEALGPEWKGAFFDYDQRERALDILIRSGKPWGAELREEFAHRAAMGHMVVVDRLDEAGNLMIRDPLHGTRYEMTREAFLKHWSNRAVYRKDM